MTRREAQQRGLNTNHPGVIDCRGNSCLFYRTAALPGGGESLLNFDWWQLE